MSSCPLQDIDEAGNHHSQQTDTGTENQTSHVLTHREVLNNENTWTQGGEHHTLGSVGGLGQGQQRVGRLGRDNIGRNVRYRWWGMEAANHIAMCIPMQQSCIICTCTPEPKVPLKEKKKKTQNLFKSSNSTNIMSIIMKTEIFKRVLFFFYSWSHSR